MGLTITFAVGRLGDVARPALVLDDLRRPVHGRPGALGPGLRDLVMAALRRREALRRGGGAVAHPRPRQADAGLHDALGLHALLAVPDHLVGQPARRDPLVHPALARRLAVPGDPGRDLPLRAAVPDAALARPEAQRGTLAGIAGLVFLFRLLDLFWLVAPDLAGHGAHEPSLALHWLDLATTLAVGGLWLAFFARELKGRPLLPVGDPEIRELMQEAGAVPGHS